MTGKTRSSTFPASALLLVGLSNVLVACDEAPPSNHLQAASDTAEQDTSGFATSTDEHSSNPAELITTPAVTTLGSPSPSGTDADALPGGLSCADFADAGLTACADSGPPCPEDQSPRSCDEDRGCYCGPKLRHSEAI